MSLAAALDLELVGAEPVTLNQPRAGWLFGSGRVETLGAAIAAAATELVIINGPITPKQQ